MAAKLASSLALALCACGGPTQGEEAPPLAPPTSIPVAAANASGARFPQPTLVAPTGTRRQPPTIPQVPEDPFGFPPEMVDAGPKPPPPPPKKKGTQL